MALSVSNKKKLGVLLLVGPILLLVTAFVLTAISSSMSTEPVDGQLFGESSPIETFLNALAFLSGAIGLLTLLPGLIIGIIFLSKKG